MGMAEDYYNHMYKSNISAIAKTLYYPYKFRNVFVDGTCCCFKTSLLNSLPSIKLMYKPNNRNTSNLSNLSYKSKYDHEVLDKPHLFCDRTPINCYDWIRMWELVSFFGCEKGASIEDIETKILELEELYDYDVLNDQIVNTYPTVILTDSRTNRVYLNLRHRNQGSDRIRSYWKNYVEIQNAYYKRKAEKYNLVHIELSKYPNISEYLSSASILLKALKINLDYNKNIVVEPFEPVTLPVANQFIRPQLFESACEFERFKSAGSDYKKDC